MIVYEDPLLNPVIRRLPQQKSQQLFVIRPKRRQQFFRPIGSLTQIPTNVVLDYTDNAASSITSPSRGRFISKTKL